LNGDLPLNTETGLTVEDGVGLESVDTSPVEQVDTAGCEDDADIHISCADEDDKSIHYAESVPTAVLQPNGEFMCSSCGETTKCARTIKRHISTHMISQLSEHSATPCLQTADVGKDDVMRKCPKKQDGGYKKLRRPENNKDSGKPWRSYVCKDCGNVFTSSALLDLHRVQMHRPHECQKCGMVVIGRRNFSQHVRSEHPGLHIYKVVIIIYNFCFETIAVYYFFIICIVPVPSVLWSYCCDVLVLSAYRVWQIKVIPCRVLLISQQRI